MIRSVKTYIGFVRESIKRRGLIVTIKLILWELLFDTIYRVDTFSIAELDSLGLDEKSVTHGRRYQASNYFLLMQALQNLRKEMGNDWNQAELIDVGSGKGRVLLLAALYGIKSVIGLEIAEELNRAAQRNIQALSRRKGISVDQFKLITGDAAFTPLPDTVNIVYLANPFDETILSEVIQQIQVSKDRHNRRIWIVYMTPIHDDLFSNESFELVRRYHTDYSIYLLDN